MKNCYIHSVVQGFNIIPSVEDSNRIPFADDYNRFRFCDGLQEESVLGGFQ